MIVCHVLKRKKGDLYLTPYLAEGNGSSVDDVVIRSYGQLDQHRHDQMNIAMYSDIDYSVDRWIIDKRYIPRLLVSAVGFLATYFFCSLVVRDPVPMIDELAFSILAAILIWRFASKRDVKCAQAQNLRTLLKDKAAVAMVQDDPTLRESEELLDHLSGTASRELADAIVNKKLQTINKDDVLLQQLVGYASVHAKETEYWYERLEKPGKHPDLLSVQLSDAILNAKVDGTLLALMVDLRG